MRFRVLIIFLAGLLMAVAATAQSCDVPVDVVALEKGTNAGGIIRGLKAEDLVASESKSHRFSIDSLTYDAGPRRIAFVIDTNRELPADARKAEAQIAAFILDHARPMDSFALITARGTAREVKFDQGRDAVKDAVRDLTGDPREKSNNLGVLDATEQAIGWFGTPQSGDAIFLLVMDTEGNHKTNARKVSESLEEHHIRLFSIAFGFINLGNSVKSKQTMTSTGLGTAQNDMDSGVVYENGEQKLFPMVVNSGGYMHADYASDPHHEFRLAEHLPRLQQIGMQFYQIMAEYYHMKIDLPGHASNWTVELSDAAKQHWTPIWSLYPHNINSCGK